MATRTCSGQSTKWRSAGRPGSVYRTASRAGSGSGAAPSRSARSRQGQAGLLTGFFSENETTDGQARLLADAQIRGGDWHLARTIFDRVRAVTAADVQVFARARMTKLQTVFLGDPKTVDEALLKSL